ncbi:MAG TPA: hypothetical protein VEF06_03765, partial [Bryobacteraceae bacterium]|nr:hypothetical protein [Bryobacteraceae bacterium]
MEKTAKIASIVGFISVIAAPALPNTLPTNPGLNLPFAFVENQGQADSAVRYVGNGPEFKAWFRKDGVILQQRETAVHVTFAGASLMKNPSIVPADPIGATASYFHGNDAAGWQKGLPLYASLHYEGVWPGIEVNYKAIDGRVKAEYLVAPGARAGEIELHFDGEASIEADGTLHIHTATGDFVEDKPVLFQTVNGERREVPGAFRRLADGSIGFAVGAYDTTQPLVIDPAILFSGFFGGNSQDAITALALDSYGNVIVAGWTSSTNLPASEGARKTNAGGVDAFVAAFAPNGGGLMWCTYLGGSGDDRAFGLALD